MKYTVTLKLLYPDGYAGWETRTITADAIDEADAVARAKKLVKKIERYKECQVIDQRVTNYREGDECKFSYEAKCWTLEEENKTAPAEIARALNRIADNMRDLKQSPVPVVQEKGIDPFAFAALIFSSISVITSVILILLFRQ